MIKNRIAFSTASTLVLASLPGCAVHGECVVPSEQTGRDLQLGVLD
jgi:hypothetical protein